MRNQAIIMQGVPGCGKSTYLMLQHPDAVVCSADFYFQRDGEYRFNPRELDKAHATCFRCFIEALAAGAPKVAVDNTNIYVVHMAPYYLAARAFEYDVEIVRVVCDPAVAAERNVHSVPSRSIFEAARNMEDPPPYWKVKLRNVSN